MRRRGCARCAPRTRSSWTNGRVFRSGGRVRRRWRRRGWRLCWGDRGCRRIDLGGIGRWMRGKGCRKWLWRRSRRGREGFARRRGRGGRGRGEREGGWALWRGEGGRWRWSGRVTVGWRRGGLKSFNSDVWKLTRVCCGCCSVLSVPASSHRER